MIDHNISAPSSFRAHVDPGRTYLSQLSTSIDGLSRTLRNLSLSIHDNPELQYKEIHAHHILTTYLSTLPGWTVTPHAYGINTAFVAVYDTKIAGPAVSFNAEYDALKGIGHACGHNLIAVVSVGAAVATAELVSREGLGGKVVLFGTPAEEGGGGKIRLLQAGAYREIDISLISHPGVAPDSSLMRTAAYSCFKAEYFGREAHAAARPWDGINALDALISAYCSISMLRQQTQPGDIIEGKIVDGGLRPNIIHAYASGLFVVRSENRARLAALKKRVLACFDAGATASGVELKITQKGAYLDHSPNRVLGDRFRLAFNELGGSIPDADIDWLTGSTTASTDQGDISYAMPSLSPQFWIRSEDKDGQQLGGPHTPDFEKAAATQEAHDMAMRVAKGLAATAIDILAQPELLQAAKREFEEMVKQQ